MDDYVLYTKDLTISFGGLKACRDININIKKNCLYGLIGPNGAGKTTLFNILTGVYKPTSGSFYLDNVELTGLDQIKINHKGIARTFQNIRLFNNMSVIKNVMVGLSYLDEYRCTLFDTLFRTKRFFVVEEKMKEKAKEILQVFGLYEDRNIVSSSLPYGKQRKLEIARALSTNPKILLLDEPAAGMNPHETQELMDTIRFVRDKFDMTILLIEHDMHLVSEVCDEITVLNFGEIIASGKTKEVLSNPLVIKAYLGDE